MLLHILILIAIINSLTGKAIIARNVSDCTISEDGILLYHGKHSFTKFDQECLSWNDLQTMYVDIINEPNFYSDPSIKAAKNYCRNPNMNVDGPWCFVETESIVSMEHCNVCQSLASRATLPTDIGFIDEEATNDTDGGFFPTIRDEVKRYAAYIHERMKKLMEHIRKNIRRLRSRFSDQSNYNT